MIFLRSIERKKKSKRVIIRKYILEKQNLELLNIAWR
jgi:hypothetical protein